MNWTELVGKEMEAEYRSAEGLIGLVDTKKLDWKPSSGQNWMTMGQLLLHLVNACGSSFRGFVTGDWGMPEGVEASEMPADEMLPPAEKWPAAESVSQAKQLLAEDLQLARRMLAEAGEKRLAEQNASAPWDPRPMLLGHRLLQMVGHLGSHKSQLFYYLKLQGVPVNTGHLWAT